MAKWNPRANEIFAIATELPVRQRHAYLAQACGEDADLRRAVEEMLAAHEQAGDFLDRPAAGVPEVEPTVRPDSGPPLRTTRATSSAPWPVTRPRQGRGNAMPRRCPSRPVGKPWICRHATAIEGEIARGGMGAVLQGPRRRPGPRPGRQGAAGDAPGTAPSWCGASSRRRRSAASCSTPASSRSTSWAGCRTAGPTSP